MRELASLMERLAITGDHEELGPEQLRSIAAHVAGASSAPSDLRFATLREVEDEHIARVLAGCGGNKARAAELLGIDLSTVYRRARRF